MEPEDVTATLPLEVAAALPETAPPPAVLDGLVLYDPAALTTQLATYSEARDLFIRWLFDHLVAGIDYMLIHRKVGPRGNKADCPERANAASPTCRTCGGKATLCKPGSEKLCGLLQLRPRFRRDVESWEMLGGEPGLVTLVCELQTASGTVVAEGRGARHRDQDFGDVNKTLKMAQKSAQTDAVLRCAGLSEIFTQDLEDMPASARDADEPAPFEAPRRTQAPAPAQRAKAEPLQQTLRRSVDAAAAAKRTVAADEAGAPSDALSKPRVGRLFALLHDAIGQADVPDDQHEDVFNRAREWLGGWVATTTGRTKLTHCSYRHYDELCEQIPVAVEAALQGGARPQPRLVRRRTYSAPRPQHPMH
ncbi:MAG TPA: hypothetical protein VLK79_16575 [Gaiellales bacterium]|nr:hypothetical protein [Gaiellales bacterium]